LNLLPLVIEPVLFLNLHICGRFWGEIGEFGRNRPEKITLKRTDTVEIARRIGRKATPNFAIAMFDYDNSSGVMVRVLVLLILRYIRPLI
jgi:hypothetical protein